MKFRGIAASILVACAMSLSALSAHASDLGTPCCADLEERIAELEATGLRKGNRKVSLSISGWVAEQIVHWDDAEESNTYLSSLGTAFASNFALSGKAETPKVVNAGFVLHMEWDDGNVYTTTQDIDNGPAGPPVLYAYWFLKSDTFGKLSLGKVSPADDSAVVGIDGSGTVVAAYGVAYDIFSFAVRGGFAAGDRMIWGNASSCRGYGGGPGDCNGVPLNVVRYDTPSFAGFSATASWGEDDNWAFAGRYGGEIGEFKLAGILTYSQTTTASQGAPPDGNLQYTQASVYLQHLPTGVFLDAAWGRIDQSPNPNDFPVTDAYYLKGGARLKPSSLGATIPYAEILYATDGAAIVNDAGTATPGDDTFRVINGSSTTFWGFGAVQEIDAAAMSLWLRYRHHSLDLPAIETGDLTTIAAGAFITF